MTETILANQDETKKDAPSSPKTSSRAGKQSIDGNDRPKASEKVEKPPTKVVVRRLPPTMSLETFLDQVAPLPPVDYMYFVKADSSLAPHSFCRAYLHFIHVSDLLIFTEKFDNYVFVDSKGNEFPAIVEYAPFQRIPKQRSSRKKDPRIGTIENDPFYQEFLENLKAEETQRKSASKTNKQHFFETSTSTSAPKVTSTPLLEFLKVRRADKLRTKEDKLAERRKREIERRKVREEARTTVKQLRISEGDKEAASSPSSQIKPLQSSSEPTSDLAEIQTRYLRCMIGLDTDTSGLEKIAGHAIGGEKVSKDMSDTKRASKDAGVKEIVSRRREDERNKYRENDKRQREKEDRDYSRDIKRDSQRESVKDSTSTYEKDRENPNAFGDMRSRETRRGGKSYQEERQRLNERRQATKSTPSKQMFGGDGNKTSKADENTQDEGSSEKKANTRKEVDISSDSKSRPQEKFRGSDHSRHQTGRDARKFEKPVKSSRDQDQRRSQDSKKIIDNDHAEHVKDVKKNAPNEKKYEERSTPVISLNDCKSVELGRPSQLKEETRKKSYSQEREQRRTAAADRKSHNPRDSALSIRCDEKTTCLQVETSTDSKKPIDGNQNGADSSERKRRPSLDNTKKKGSSQEEPSRSRSLADIQTLKSSSGSDAVVERRKEKMSSKNEDKERKDPRAERRIRNKDRPSIEIYRPGMGRFSRQRLEREKEKGLNKESSTERDSPSSSPSPVPSVAKASVIPEITDE